MRATITCAVIAGCAALTGAITVVAPSSAGPKQDRYSVSVPGGLAFSAFKGYETWQVISLSRKEALMAVILGNPTIIKAYQAGLPANGKPFPDGSKMAKIHWVPKKSETAPGPTTTVPGALHDVDFMEKDAKRFAASGGWGYAAFQYDPASATFRPSTTADRPPQSNDARCGFSCHTIVETRDFVFTEFPER